MPLHIKLDGNNCFKQLPPFTDLSDKNEAREKLKKYLESGYVHGVEFAISRHIFVPDSPWIPEGNRYWRSGDGLRVLRHLFLFQEAMTHSWAEDISSCFQSCDARYLGLHVPYIVHEPMKARFVAAEATADHLSAWLRLMWNKNFIPQDPDSFMEKLL